MAALPETDQWEEGIYQLETTDVVEGGPDGIDNVQAKALANRTLYLKNLVAALTLGKQPLDATLTALAAIATVADKLIYATGADTFATTTLTAFARTLLDDGDAATARATLGAAPLASPALTGTPTAPTAVAGTNNTQLANTAFVQAAIAALVATSPAALDTLNELATALGNDPNFATTITTALAGKQPLDTDLSAIAALVSAANKLPYATGAGTWAMADLTAFARTLLDDIDAATARTTLGLGTAATLVSDADGTLATNSDSRLPTQKAVKTYVDGLIAAQDAMVFKGVTDCSTNPNYPAADRGHTYRVSVAGKIGGAAGLNVEAGDILICLTDGTAAGNQAGVGANWGVIQANLDGALLNTAIGVTVQGYDADLSAIAALVSAANKLPYATGAGTWAMADLTAFARTLLAAANAGAARVAMSAAPEGGGLVPIAASVNANALTLTINPTSFAFRSADVTNGDVTELDLAAPVSVVVPSGATLGMVANVSARLALLAINNGGVIEAAVVNIAGGINLDETGVISTTAISAAADSSSVIYSTTARANVPYKVAGFIDITEAVPGTYATPHSTIQSAGGLAAAAMAAYGAGKKWQSMTGSRSYATTYYNTTGKEITVFIANSGSGAPQHLIGTVDGLQVANEFTNNQEFSSYINFDVPAGSSYSVTGQTLTSWMEKR